MNLVTLLDALYDVPQLTVRSFSMIILLFCNAKLRIICKWCESIMYLDVEFIDASICTLGFSFHAFISLHEGATADLGL
jgi:hypothetical protein